jgi:uncharacterized protein
MKDLLEYIVKSLVNNPEGVNIDEYSEGGSVNLTLTVDPADMGLVIGKGGQTINAIRKLLTVRAISENVRVNLQLAEPEGGVPTDQSVPDSEKSEETPVEENSEELGGKEETSENKEPNEEASTPDDTSKQPE